MRFTQKKVNQLGLENYIYLFLKFVDQIISKFKMKINSNFMSKFRN